MKFYSVRRLALFGCALAAMLAGCQKAQTPYERTLAELDQGGVALQYFEVGEILGKVHAAAGTVGKIIIDNAPSEQRMTTALGVGAVLQALKQLNIEAIQTVGGSCFKLGARDYRFRSFMYTGMRPPKGLLFDLMGRQNGELASLSAIPGDAVFAFGTRAGASQLFDGVSQAVSKDNPMFAGTLTGLKQSFKQSTGIALEDLLASVDGELYGYVALGADGKVRFLLSVPDKKGQLAALLKKQLPIRDNRFELPNPGAGLPAFKAMKPVLVLGGQRVELRSNEKMPAGPAQSKELAVWIASMPKAGLGYSYFNVSADAEKALLSVMRNRSSAQLIAMLKRPAVLQVGFLKDHGYASLARSTHSQLELQVMMPVFFAGNGLLKAFSQARTRAPSIAGVSQAKQLGLGFAMYANDNKGLYPAPDGIEGLKKLEKFLPAPKIYQSPLPGVKVRKVSELNDATCAFYYIAGGLNLSKVRRPSQYPVLFAKPGRGMSNPVPVLFADGHVEGLVVPHYTRAVQVVNALAAKYNYAPDFRARLIEKVARLR